MSSAFTPPSSCTGCAAKRSNDPQRLGVGDVLHQPKERGTAADELSPGRIVVDTFDLAHQRLALILQEGQQRLAFVGVESRWLQVGHSGHLASADVQDCRASTALRTRHRRRSTTASLHRARSSGRWGDSSHGSAPLRDASANCRSSRHDHTTCIDGGATSWLPMRQAVLATGRRRGDVGHDRVEVRAIRHHHELPIVTIGSARCPSGHRGTVGLMPDDASLRPFRIDVPDEVLQDLRASHRHVRAGRRPRPSTIGARALPCRGSSDMCRYWADGYDWRATRGPAEPLRPVHDDHRRARHPLRHINAHRTPTRCRW